MLTTGKRIYHIQREFTQQFRIEEEKLGAVWPRLFLAWPEDKSLLTRINRLGGKTVCVQLICEAPGCWHQPAEGGFYKIEYLPNWQKSIHPVFAKMVGALKMASPVLTASFGISYPDLEKRLKFTEEVGKTVNLDDTQDNHEDNAGFLRHILMNKDPDGKDYGLRRVLTKEHHVFWVCDEHYAQYDEKGRFFPF